MYVNSGTYHPSTMMSTGTFSHQIGLNSTSPAPTGAYMGSALVPNLVFRQNVPVSITATILRKESKSNG